MSLTSKVRGMLRENKSKIDKGLDKGQQAVSDRTGGKYDDRIRSARQKADDALSEDERPRSDGPGQGAPPRDNPEDGDTGPTRR